MSAENEVAFPVARRQLALGDVALGADGAVAVGNVYGEHAGGRVWRSLDRRNWRAVSRPFVNATLTSVLSHERSWVLAGASAPRGYRAPALWWSDDGRSWRRAVMRAAPALGNVADLVSAGERLIAVVNEYEPGAVSIALWSSADGRRWRRHRRVARGLDVATGACADGSSVLVVATSAVPDRRAAVLFAPRGPGLRGWRADLRRSQGTLSACAVRGAHAVAVGIDRGFAAAWYREAGTWLEARTVELTATAPASLLHAVAPAPVGFLAAGTSGRRGQSDVALWHSREGRRWQPLDLREAGREEGYQGARAIAITRDVTLLGGQHGAGDAGLWIGPTPSRAVP